MGFCVHSALPLCEPLDKLPELGERKVGNEARLQLQISGLTPDQIFEMRSEFEGPKDSLHVFAG